MLGRVDDKNRKMEVFVIAFDSLKMFHIRITSVVAEKSRLRPLNILNEISFDVIYFI